MFGEPLGIRYGRGSGVSATPYSFNGGADGWREGCLQAGAVTAMRRGPRAAGGRREAVSVTVKQPVAAQDAVIFNEPGRRARVACGDGGDPMPRVHAPAGYGIGAALQITALVWLPGSKHPLKSFMPAVRSANVEFSWPGFVGRVAPARARFALTPRPASGASGEVRQGKQGGAT